MRIWFAFHWLQLCSRFIIYFCGNQNATIHPHQYRMAVALYIESIKSNLNEFERWIFVALTISFVQLTTHLLSKKMVISHNEITIPVSIQVNIFGVKFERDNICIQFSCEICNIWCYSDEEKWKKISTLYTYPMWTSSINRSHIQRRWNRTPQGVIIWYQIDQSIERIFGKCTLLYSNSKRKRASRSIFIFQIEDGLNFINTLNLSQRNPVERQMDYFWSVHATDSIMISSCWLSRQ